MRSSSSITAAAALLVCAAWACGEPAVTPDATVFDAGAPDAGPASVCGDGVVGADEQCDDGNDDDTDLCTSECTLTVEEIHDVAIKWWFNRVEELGFEGDACVDLGVAEVEVELELITQPSLRYVRTETCALRQVAFLGVPIGGYRIRVRPLDADGVPKTSAPVAVDEFVGPPRLTIDVDVAPDDWRDDYTGAFFFRLRWGEAAVDCLEAVPPVARHVLLLERDGAPVSLTTDAGDPLDGSAEGPCRSLTEEFPQAALEVPFGAARFTVIGLDEGGAEAYRAAFDTFVGAGVSNPELWFDVVPVTPGG